MVSASSFEVDVSDDYVAKIKQRMPDTLVVGIGQGHYFTKDFDLNEAGEIGAGYDAILLGEPEEEIFHLIEQMGADRLPQAAWRSYYRTSVEEGKKFSVQDSDVLAFPIESLVPGELPVVVDGGPPPTIGDVLICPAVVRQNAERAGVAFDDELALMVVHGLLHLLGYDHVDDEDAERMEARERKLLAAAGSIRP